MLDCAMFYELLSFFTSSQCPDDMGLCLTYARTHACICIYTRTHRHIRAHIHARTHTPVRVCIRISRCIHACLCVCVCVYLWPAATNDVRACDVIGQHLPSVLVCFSLPPPNVSCLQSHSFCLTPSLLSYLSHCNSF